MPYQKFQPDPAVFRQLLDKVSKGKIRQRDNMPLKKSRLSQPAILPAGDNISYETAGEAQRRYQRLPIVGRTRVYKRNKRTTTKRKPQKKKLTKPKKNFLKK